MSKQFRSKFECLTPFQKLLLVVSYTNFLLDLRLYVYKIVLYVIYLLFHNLNITPPGRDIAPAHNLPHWSHFPSLNRMFGLVGSIETIFVRDVGELETPSQTILCKSLPVEITNSLSVPLTGTTSETQFSCPAIKFKIN